MKEAGAASVDSRRAIRAYLRKLLLATSPLLLGLVFLEAVLWRTGEIRTNESVVGQQGQRQDALFVRAFANQNFAGYKYRLLVERRPTIVALGSSRTMQFRAPMFGADSVRFVNLGGMIQNVHDLEAFAELTPAAVLPRVAIVGVDMWWLNAAWVSAPQLRDVIRGGASPWEWQEHLTVMRKLASRPSDLRRAVAMAFSQDSSRIGLGALFQPGAGFRGDGSYRMSTPIPVGRWEFRDHEDPPIVERVRRGLDRFDRTRGVDEQLYGRLRSAIRTLSERGVLVIGFMPPVATPVARALAEDEVQRGIWAEYQVKVRDAFRELNLPFVDASTPDRIGLDDRYMVDGFHALETFHAHLVLRMLEDPRVAAAMPHARDASIFLVRSEGTNPWYLASH